MASAVDSRLAYARLSAVATASRLPTATRGSNNSYTTSWDTTLALQDGRARSWPDWGESLAVLGANCSRIRCGRHCSATMELAPPADQRQPFRTGTELPAFLQDFANVPCSPRGRG